MDMYVYKKKQKEKSKNEAVFRQDRGETVCPMWRNVYLIKLNLVFSAHMNEQFYLSFLKEQILNFLLH